MKRTSRKPSTLSESLQHHLNAYALAASAAGVGMLALAQPAEAKIIYTRTHHFILERGRYDLDLNHDGITDFVLYQTASGPSRNRLSVKERLRNGVKGDGSGAAALKRGARIGARQTFIAGTELRGVTMVSLGCTSTTCWTSGPWVNVTNRYLGLKFEIRGKTHYGWARLTVKLPGHQMRDNYPIRAKLTGYAYETIPGKAIIAGQTKGPDVITVQPATLGALAAGASGRKRRK